MKKKYSNPVILVVRLHAANHILSGSGGGPVTSVNNSEGFTIDNNGFDDDDVLR